MENDNQAPDRQRKPTTQKKWPKWAKAFLAALRETGNYSAAARAAQIDRTITYELRNSDATFAEACSKAVDEATDMLEQEARRRAIDGLKKKKFCKNGSPLIDPETGEQYVEHEYSDTLLIFLLKGNRPEKFRERMDVNATNQIKGEMELKHRGIDLSKLTDEQIRQLEQIAAAISPIPPGADPANVGGDGVGAVPPVA